MHACASIKTLVLPQARISRDAKDYRYRLSAMKGKNYLSNFTIPEMAPSTHDAHAYCSIGKVRLDSTLNSQLFIIN